MISQRLTACHYLHTGQRTCHADEGRELSCEGSGQDASFAVGTPCPEPRFDFHGDEVMDRLTGLLWRRSGSLTPQPVVWREELVTVAELDQEGAVNPWRLPTINELESRVDCAAHCPSLLFGYSFADAQDIYWSSATSLFEPDLAWTLCLEKGVMGVGQKAVLSFASWASLRAVRPFSRHENQGATWARDKAQRTSNGGQTFPTAAQSCLNPLTRTIA